MAAAQEKWGNIFCLWRFINRVNLPTDRVRFRRGSVDVEEWTLPRLGLKKALEESDRQMRKEIEVRRLEAEMR